jgi:AraC-like DNA-binding protein
VRLVRCKCLGFRIALQFAVLSTSVRLPIGARGDRSLVSALDTSYPRAEFTGRHGVSLVYAVPMVIMGQVRNSRAPGHVPMTEVRPNEKIYPVGKIALVIDALKAEGVSPRDSLAGIQLSEAQLRSPAVRVSPDQVIQSYSNAAKLSRNPHFAFQLGLRFHVSTYGMYGFAILSSTDFRETMAIAMKYHQLASPLVDIEFTERGGIAAWTMLPKPYRRVDEDLYRFIVELQTGVHLSLHRDVMGQSFCPREIRFSFPRPRNERQDFDVFGCPVCYGDAEDKLLFDAVWLDASPKFGNDVTHSEIRDICDNLLKDLKLSAGWAGRVREIILARLDQPASFEQVASRLKTSTRTLRRKLELEGTSFRELIDELKAQIAIRYVRDTDLTVEDVAFRLGFSDAAAFRHAFRRWTNSSPQGLRRAKTEGGARLAGQAVLTQAEGS